MSECIFSLINTHGLHAEIKKQNFKVRIDLPGTPKARDDENSKKLEKKLKKNIGFVKPKGVSSCADRHGPPLK